MGTEKPPREPLIRAALDRMIGSSLSVFEYLLAVGTVAALILNVQPDDKPIATPAAIFISVVISVPAMFLIHLWTIWEKRKKEDRKQ